MSSLRRIYRLLELIGILQSGRAHNANQLADLCEVSRRTIFRDLHALQAAGIPIEYDQARQGYYVPSSFFLPPTNFNLEEALALLVICYELGTERGLPFYGPARTAALKLESSLPGRLRDYLNEVTQAVQVRLDQVNPLTDREPIYRQLLGAIAQRRAVRITYDSFFERRVIRTRLGPYRVLFVRRSWYVIGRSSLHRSVRTFNVSRIRHLEVLDDHYRIPPRFSLERYLGNAWHLIREPGQRHRVHVRFQPMVARNVAEVCWHKTQKLRWNRDGTLDFRVSVDGLQEIMWWLLGYGDQVEVMRPARLRRMLAERIERMAALYARPDRRRAPRGPRASGGTKRRRLK